MQPKSQVTVSHAQGAGRTVVVGHVLQGSRCGRREIAVVLRHDEVYHLRVRVLLRAESLESGRTVVRDLRGGNLKSESQFG